MAKDENMQIRFLRPWKAYSRGDVAVFTPKTCFELCKDLGEQAGGAFAEIVQTEAEAVDEYLDKSAEQEAEARVQAAKLKAATERRVKDAEARVAAKIKERAGVAVAKGA